MLTFEEARESCTKGNFVSHSSFDHKQSMHYYKGEFFYEDGANLSHNGFEDWVKTQAWANIGWFVKCPAELIEKTMLKNMHEKYKDHMLPQGVSYEECLFYKDERTI